MGVIYLIQILRLEGYFEGQGLGLAKGGGKGVYHLSPLRYCGYFVVILFRESALTI